jgi:hypothetical protein
VRSRWSFLEGIADAPSGDCQRFAATSLSSPSEVVRAKAGRQPIHCTDIRSRLSGDLQVLTPRPVLTLIARFPFSYIGCAPTALSYAPVRFHPRPKRVYEFRDFQEDEGHPLVNAKMAEAVNDRLLMRCRRSQRIGSRMRRQNTVERLT